MTTLTLPDLAELKAQAKRLRAALEVDGDFITHSESLELIARQNGYRDWNTLHARAGNRPSEPYRIGDQRSGTYLGQPFTGEILSVKRLGDGALYEISFDFDEPVDVVRFDSFSAFRKRVSVTLDRDGVSPARTSNGEPHVRLSR
ncbi:glyoxalase superfamily protein [Oceanicaulis sp. LC35]|uniref:glyoxalase superfamily protein n=1 Tax=Oceanicaulis sp. LC35 TaxID=3349635 RepID=UPI003F838A48